MKYVVGLCFDESMTSVVLIHKKTGPECVIGKLNGLGGKVEESEDSLHAMVREFSEECGILTKTSDWFNFLTIIHNEEPIDFFCTKTQKVWQAITTESETIEIISVPDALSRDNLMPNLRWIISFLCDPSVVHYMGTIYYR